MNSLEGSGNVITVTREEFTKGPRRLENVTTLSRRVLAPVFYMPRYKEEKLATVTQLPTALSEKVPPMDPVLEQLIETDIVSGIIEQLETTGRHLEVENIQNAQRTLISLGYAPEDVREYVMDYMATVDPDLFNKALMAIDIVQAREGIVDIEVFAVMHGRA